MLFLCPDAFGQALGNGIVAGIQEAKFENQLEDVLAINPNAGAAYKRARNSGVSHEDFLKLINGGGQTSKVFSELVSLGYEAESLLASGVSGKEVWGAVPGLEQRGLIVSPDGTTTQVTQGETLGMRVIEKMSEFSNNLNEINEVVPLEVIEKSIQAALFGPMAAAVDYVGGEAIDWAVGDQIQEVVTYGADLLQAAAHGTDIQTIQNLKDDTYLKSLNIQAEKFGEAKSYLLTAVEEGELSIHDPEVQSRLAMADEHIASAQLANSVSPQIKEGGGGASLLLVAILGAVGAGKGIASYIDARRSNPFDGSRVKHAKGGLDVKTAKLYDDLNAKRADMLANGSLSRPHQRRNVSGASGRIIDVEAGNKIDAIDGQGPWTNRTTTADGTVIKYNAEGFPVFDDVLHVSDKIKANTVTIKMTGVRKDDVTAANLAAGIDKKYLTKHKLTWHHHQDLGVMQLIPDKYHSPTSHSGGVTLYNQYVKLGLIDGPLYTKQGN